jgi:tRNA-specific 2-thiouridylase
VRYRGTPHRGRVVRAGGQVRVDFDTPVSAVVSGQYAVFYDGDRVLGGGVISGTVAAAGVAEELRP